jgi:hypothetical protein
MKVWHQEAMELRDRIADSTERGIQLRRLLWEVAHNEYSTPGTLKLLAELTAEFEKSKGR